MRLICFEDRRTPHVALFARSARNAGYRLEIEAPPADDGTAFAHFRSIYRHLSVNPSAFELACFRRYFLMRDRLGADERAIMADSDLIVQTPPGHLPEPLLGFGEGLVGSIGRQNGLAEADISPHFSFWTGRLVAGFCDYLIDTYLTRADELAADYAARQARTTRASISDMALLRRWVDDCGVPLLDSNRLFGDATIDHNVSMAECADGRFATTWGRKRLTLPRDRIRFLTVDGVSIVPAVIHLQGRYKLAAPALARRDRLRLASVSAYIAAGRVARRVIAR